MFARNPPRIATPARRAAGPAGTVRPYTVLRRMASAIPDTLVPPGIARDRAQLRLGQQLAVASWVIPIILAYPTAIAALMLVQHPAFGAEFVAATVGVVGTAVSAVAGLVVHRRSRAVSDAIRQRIRLFDVRVHDPRWPGAVNVLRRLRGDDPDSARAHRIYEMTRALAEEFARHDVLVGLTRPGAQAGGEVARLAAVHDAALDQVIAQLAHAVLESTLGDGAVSEALEDAFRDLRAIVSAEAEVAGRALPRLTLDR